MSARPRFVAASKSLLRESVLGAVDDLVREHRWSDVSMAKVAEAAGVSRQTLYNAFGTRDDLVAAYVLWAAEGLLDDVEHLIREHRDDMVAALRAGFERFLSVAPEHPLVRALVASSGSDDLHTLVSTPAGTPLIVNATSRLSEILLGVWPALPGEAVFVVADLLIRLAISNVTIPVRSPQEVAAAVELVAGPFVASIAAAYPDALVPAEPT